MMDEAKRLVDIVYDSEAVFYNDKDLFEKELDKKFKDFSICVELILIPLCHMKYEGFDYKSEKVKMKQILNHYKKYIPYKEAQSDINMEEITSKIATEIINNYDKYSNKSLFEVIPNLANRYMKCHNDSVDHEAIVMLLEEELKKQNKKLLNCNINSLVTI